MATVEEDLVSGHRAVYVASSAEIVRTFRVWDLTSQPWAQLDEALTDPNIPDIGDFYPTPPANNNLRVREKSAVPDGPNAARVTCIYSNRQGPTWNQAPPVNDGQDVKQITASIVPKRTTLDEVGAPMLLNPPASAPSLPDYKSEADIQKPVGALVFERTEADPPSARMRGKVGLLNSDTLGGNYPIRTLLFARLDAQSDDGGATWRVTYEFRYDPDGWVHRDTYKFQSGRAIADAAETTWDVYAATTFSDLGLDFSDSQVPL